MGSEGSGLQDTRNTVNNSDHNVEAATSKPRCNKHQGQLSIHLSADEVGRAIAIGPRKGVRQPLPNVLRSLRLDLRPPLPAEQKNAPVPPQERGTGMEEEWTSVLSHG